LALRNMGGTPSEILDDEPMIKVLLPRIRVEIRLAELRNERYGAGVDVPITAVYGRDAIDDSAAMGGWPRFSRRLGEVLAIPGELIDIINARLGRAGD
jgi:medium-chain acyl-[acyl-carrier-protein] hydrolase